jgi:hypothetical protein
LEGGSIANQDLVDLGQGRGKVRHVFQEVVQGNLFSFCVNLDPLRGVGNPSFDPPLLGQSKNKGAKPHPLHDALDLYVAARDHLLIPIIFFCAQPYE